jgi:hypothetical protein
MQAIMAMLEDLTTSPDLEGLPVDAPPMPMPPMPGSGGMPANPLQMIAGVLDALSPPACPTEE